MQKTTLTKNYEILGKGGFGCVVEPYITCDSKQHSFSDKKKVSKILAIVKKEKIKRAYREQEIADLLKKIDPEQKYFLGPSKMCKLSYKQNVDILHKCFAEKNKDSINNVFFNLQLLKAENFSEILKTRITPDNFLKMFLHLVQGANTLKQNTDLTLCDIKKENLMFRKVESGYYVVFIDFSALHVIKNNPSSNWFSYNTEFGRMYHPWPYEMKFLFGQNSQPQVDWKDIVRHVLDTSR